MERGIYGEFAHKRMKEQRNFEDNNIREIEMADLKEGDEVILHEPSWDLDVKADGGFIKRLAEGVKKHQREVKLTVIGGSIIAVVLAADKTRRRKK